MRAFITIQTAKGSQLVDAITLGDFAIHRETGCREKGTGAPLYALTHIPTGLQVDGHYRSPIYLRSAIRFLASCEWPAEAEKIKTSPQCKLDAIKAAEMAEASSHWALKRNFAEIKKQLQGA